MLKKVLIAAVLLPAGLFAGAVNFSFLPTSGVQFLSVPGGAPGSGTMTFGSDNCSASCVVSGTAISGNLLLPWQFSFGNPTATYTDNGPNSAGLTGGSGTFKISDKVAQTNLGGATGTDELDATFSLTSFLTNGTSATANGTITFTSFTATDAASLVFTLLASNGGLTLPIPGGGETQNLSIAVSNCVLPGPPPVSGSCVNLVDPTGTITGVGTSAIVVSGVPEPGTIALLGIGLVGLLAKRRWLN